jgi:hypothetical protein
MPLTALRINLPRQPGLVTDFIVVISQDWFPSGHVLYLVQAAMWRTIWSTFTRWPRDAPLPHAHVACPYHGATGRTPNEVGYALHL